MSNWRRATSAWTGPPASKTRQHPPVPGRNTPAALSEEGLTLLAELIDKATPGLRAMTHSRFFGWVIGGTLPAALAADWLVSAWRNSISSRTTVPAAAARHALPVVPVHDFQVTNNDLVAATHGRYAGHAYAFVLAALEHCQVRRPARGARRPGSTTGTASSRPGCEPTPPSSTRSCTCRSSRWWSTRSTTRRCPTSGAASR